MDSSWGKKEREKRHSIILWFQEYPFLAESKAPFKQLLHFEHIFDFIFSFKVTKGKCSLRMTPFLCTNAFLCWLPQMWQIIHIDILATLFSLFLLLSYISWLFSLFTFYIPETVHLWTTRTTGSSLHTLSSWHELFSLFLSPWSPSCFPFLHWSTSGMHKGEAPGWIKEAAEDWGLAGKLPKSYFTSGNSLGCWGGEYPLATSWRTKMHLLILLHSLYSDSCPGPAVYVRSSFTCYFLRKIFDTICTQ